MWNSGEQQQQKDMRVATVGPSASIKGEISGSEDLTVDGQVEGRIELPEHTLTIGASATVLAEINARIVIILGTVVGSVFAREKAEIRKTAAVEGSLICGQLAVQEGARINGKVETKSRPAATARSKADRVA
jgi:cytoskeletal protein CcmA (bactofilin family)